MAEQETMLVLMTIKYRTVLLRVPKTLDKTFKISYEQYDFILREVFKYPDGITVIG